MATELTAEQAVQAIERCAFAIPDDTAPDGARRVVHCFVGSIGADWDEADAITVVRAAHVVGWAPTLFGECLVAVMPDGKRRTFDTVTP